MRRPLSGSATATSCGCVQVSALGVREGGNKLDAEVFVWMQIPPFSLELAGVSCCRIREVSMISLGQPKSSAIKYLFGSHILGFRVEYLHSHSCLSSGLGSSSPCVLPIFHRTDASPRALSFCLSSTISVEIGGGSLRLHGLGRF
ncbi:hypothetical protein B0H12DRAFT_162706 [Mycena haematopus]|nr:hypothetical protein B0H12DRAFT_162706 [Mycena haematopus]